MHQLIFRSRRQKGIKFVGRRISHLWKDSDIKARLYCGSVLSVKRGNDGDDNALYEVQYNGDDQIYEIDNLAADLRDSQLRFIDF